MGDLNQALKAQLASLEAQDLADMEDATVEEPGLPAEVDDEEEVGALFTIAGVGALALNQIKGRDCWSTCGNRGMLPCPKACGPLSCCRRGWKECGFFRGCRGRHCCS